MLERLSSWNALCRINGQHAVDESLGFHRHRVPFRRRILQPNHAFIVTSNGKLTVFAAAIFQELLKVTYLISATHDMYFSSWLPITSHSRESITVPIQLVWSSDAATCQKAYNGCQHFLICSHPSQCNKKCTGLSTVFISTTAWQS